MKKVRASDKNISILLFLPKIELFENCNKVLNKEYEIKSA